MKNRESFYLLVEFKEDPERENFKTTIMSIAKEKGIKIYQMDNYIFQPML